MVRIDVALVYKRIALIAKGAITFSVVRIIKEDEGPQTARHDEYISYQLQWALKITSYVWWSVHVRVEHPHPA